MADAGWAGLVSMSGVSAGGNIHISVTQVLAAATTTAAGRVVGRIPTLPAHFVFRREFEALAKRVAASPVTAVVTGMRGVGKTQLAAAYARAVLTTGECDLVGWIDAETSGTLLEGLAAVAEQQGVADPDGDSYRSAIRLRDYLSDSTRTGLLVFDNATDPDRLSEFLPVLGATKVVITSTDHDFTSLGAALDLEVYDRAVSVRYLHDATGHRATPPDDAGAGEIAEDLGDLPLALAQAATTITARRLDYTTYRQLLTGPLPRALTRRRGDPHRLRVDTAILLSIETTGGPWSAGRGTREHRRNRPHRTGRGALGPGRLLSTDAGQLVLASAGGDVFVMAGRPARERHHGIEERPSQRGQVVLDPGRHLGVGRAGEQPVALQGLQRHREHPLRDARDAEQVDRMTIRCGTGERAGVVPSEGESFASSVTPNSTL